MSTSEGMKKKGERLFFCGFPLWRTCMVFLLWSIVHIFSLPLSVPVWINMAVTPAAAQNGEAFLPVETVHASIQTVVQSYTAVGTVKPRSETRIDSQVRAQVKKVHVKSGALIRKGDILITLDDRQATSRLDGARASLNAAIANKQQALQGVTAAKAAHKEAELQYKRIQDYYRSQAATKQEFENAESAYHQAQASLKSSREALAAADAGIRRARQFVSEVRVGADFSKIVAPADGEVIRRMVEAGDLALPGKPLMLLRTERGFRVEAHVREGLIHRVTPGMILKAEISSLNTTCDAGVEEIIPYADPETRTFLVKASLPQLDGLFPGMYGKLMIPDTTREVVLLPQKAVIRTGQLELVKIKIDEGWQLQYIKTGKVSGDMVEVLSGLEGNEIVGVGGGL